MKLKRFWSFPPLRVLEILAIAGVIGMIALLAAAPLAGQGLLEDDFLSELQADTSAAAGASTGTSASASAWPEGLELQGEHTLSLALPLSGEHSPGFAVGERGLRPALQNQIDLGFDRGKGLSFAAGLQASSFLYKSKDAQLQLKNEFDLGPTYLSLYGLSGTWSLLLGWQDFTWGSADKISPIDVLNPRDYRLTPRRQQKLSVLAAQLQLQPISWLGLEAVYLPFYAENRTGTVSRLRSQLPAGSSLSIAGTELDFLQPTLGGRLRFYLPNFDLGLSYLYAPDTALAPEIGLTEPTQQSPIYGLKEVELQRPMLHRWGLDLRLAFNYWNLWLDTAFALNPAWQAGSYAVRSPQWDAVVGIDFFYGPHQDFYTNFQYSVRWLSDFRQKLGSDYDPTPIPNAPGQTSPVQFGKQRGYYEDYYLYQFSDRLAGHSEGLLQSLSFRIDLPFEISPPPKAAGGSAFSNPFELNLGLTFSYQLPLLYDDSQVKRLGQFYLNPELELSWDQSLNAHRSIKMALALGLEWAAALEQAKGEAPKFKTSQTGLGYYGQQSQLYLELKLFW